jgi:hypothetical protein
VLWSEGLRGDLAVVLTPGGASPAPTERLGGVFEGDYGLVVFEGDYGLAALEGDYGSVVFETDYGFGRDWR